MKKTITISLTESVWKDFQCLCIKKCQIPSIQIEEYMKKEILENGD